MSDDYTVDTTVLRACAELWRQWGDALGKGAEGISEARATVLSEVLSSTRLTQWAQPSFVS